LRLSNIFVQHQGGGTKQDSTIRPPENESVYPDPNRFGTMPVHGFFVRHVKGISMRDVEVRYMQEDSRPAVLLEDVHGADFMHMKLKHAPGVPTFMLRNVEDFNLWQSRPLPDTQVDKAEERTL